MHRHPGPASPAADNSYWNRLLAPYMKASNWKATFQLVSTAVLFAVGWWLAYLSLSVSWFLTLLVAIPTAGLLVRLFIFQHDCGHGSFFRTRRANHVVGFLLGVLILTPYQYWRRTHAIHHGTSGDLDRRGFGDVDTLTVKEYRALSWWGRAKYRIYRHPLVMLGIGPAWVFICKHRLPLDIPRTWRREWASIWWTNLIWAAILLVAWRTIGLGAFVAVHLPILLISGAAGVWLFYVQHQFEDTYWREHSDWSFHRAALEGSSLYDLPRVLHWFSGNIGYHHIHHLASRIPNYSLPRCFREVKEMQHVTRLGLWESIRCFRYKLWDEESGRLVGFREARSGGTLS